MALALPVVVSPLKHIDCLAIACPLSSRRKMRNDQTHADLARRQFPEMLCGPNRGADERPTSQLEADVHAALDTVVLEKHAQRQNRCKSAVPGAEGKPPCDRSIAANVSLRFGVTSSHTLSNLSEWGIDQGLTKVRNIRGNERIISGSDRSAALTMPAPAMARSRVSSVVSCGFQHLRASSGATALVIRVKEVCAQAMRGLIREPRYRRLGEEFVKCLQRLLDRARRVGNPRRRTNCVSPAFRPWPRSPHPT